MNGITINSFIRSEESRLYQIATEAAENLPGDVGRSVMRGAGDVKKAIFARDQEEVNRAEKGTISRFSLSQRVSALGKFILCTTAYGLVRTGIASKNQSNAIKMEQMKKLAALANVNFAIVRGNKAKTIEVAGQAHLGRAFS